MIDCHFPSSYLSYTFTDVTFPTRAIKPLSLSKCASFLILICKEFEKGKCRNLEVKMGILHHLCALALQK